MKHHHHAMKHIKVDLAVSDSRAHSGFFDHLSSAISRIAGLPITFFSALAIVVVWALTGPIFAFSEVWQLVINTGTTVITFLLLFIVQNTQNRDTKALQLKLDAIIYVLTGCDNELINAEDLTLRELEEKVAQFKIKSRQPTPMPQQKNPGEL
jgi:low affinity Fe/Cu permease